MDLKDIRTQIDAVDDELVQLFVKRMNLSAQVAEYKKANNIIEAAKEIGEEMQDCLAGWTDEDHWEIIRTKLLDVNERNVLYVLKGYFAVV